MSDRTRTPPETPTARRQPPEQGPDPLPPNAADARQAMEKFGRAPDTGHRFAYVKSPREENMIPVIGDKDPKTQRGLRELFERYDLPVPAPAAERDRPGTVVSVFKAQPTGDRLVPDLHIIGVSSWPDCDADRHMPHDQFIARSAQLHDQEAAKLEAALRASLPGGTFDRLVARLLLAKASHFLVPHGPPAPIDPLTVCGGCERPFRADDARERLTHGEHVEMWHTQCANQEEP